MSQILHSVLTAIGQTPLIDLASLVQAPCFAKMEFLNPGGSIKDRIALEMIQGAIQTGQLQPGMTILEATSGNTGIALAMVGGQLGYPVTIVMPENMSQERQQMIRAFGGRLILTPAELSIGGAVAKAKQLYAKGGYYMPMQFENPDNVRAQEKMALEALKQLDCQVDVVISGIGSGGSLQGMANVLRKVNPDCRVVAVEPLGVSSLKQDPPGMHAIQGIGDGFIPELFDPEVVTDIIEVSGSGCDCLRQRTRPKDGAIRWYLQRRESLWGQADRPDLRFRSDHSDPFARSRRTLFQHRHFRLNKRPCLS